MPALVGRADELRRIAEWLRAGKRLITLWGAPGVGKTRLASEVARRSRELAGVPAFVCTAADARDADRFCATIAAQLDVPSAGTSSTQQSMLRVSRVLAVRGPALVVVDEAGPAAAVEAALRRWLAAASSVRFLLVSRERLRLDGESALEVSPLPIADAVELLIARVHATAPSWRTLESDQARLKDLAARLEGIPLALELAAARFEVLGLDGLLDDRATRLQLLRGTRTLLDAIDWSWRLLEKPDRLALARISVFRGGFTLEAARAVLGASAADRLQSLRDKALLRSWRPDGAGASRFAPFEMVREFAARELASTPAEERMAFDRHAELYLRLAARGAQPAERENLLAIVERSVEATVPRALEAVLAVDPVLAVQGPIRLRQRLLSDVLARVNARKSPALLVARARMALAETLQRLGRVADGERELKRALADARRARDRALEGRVLAETGISRQHVRDLRGARRLYVRALALAKSAGDAWSRGRILGNLGAVEHDHRRFEAALEFYGEAHRLLARAGDVRLRGLVLTNRAVLLQEMGMRTDARRDYERARGLLRRSSDRRLEAICAGNLGALLHETGDFDGARRCHEEAIRLLGEVGDVRSEGLAFARLAAALAMLDRLDEADARLDDAAVVLEQADDAVALSAVSAVGALVDAAHAARAEAEGRNADSRRLRERARATLASLRRAAKSSDDVRWAARLVADLLAGEHAPDDALLVAPGARWFRPPGGEWRDLRLHGSARRILTALLEQRAANGPALGVTALGRAGWPGEAARPDAVANRVYVALAFLRKQGLRGWLSREADGYRLVAQLRVVPAAGGWPTA